MGDSVDIAYIDLFDATWHASIDQFLYDVDGNFEVVEGTINGASTNNVNGNTISVGGTKYSDITANYVCISAGWLAVDGYDISALNCKIYNADGTLLSTVACNLDPAEPGVVTHVSGMGYGEGTVPYRIVSANAPFVIVDLNAYKGQTVTVVYEATLVGARETIEIIRINATVS